jgi:hypothetical protein
VLEVSREAFVHGMRLTSAIAAVLAVGVAILVAVMLRSQGAPTGDAELKAGAEHVGHGARPLLEEAEG